MKGWLIAIIVILFIALGIAIGQIKEAEGKWKNAEANVKAYSELLSTSEGTNTALSLTVEQLKYFKDSVLKELDTTRRELGIKDKKLKALQSVSSSFSVRDTLILRDTLFREPEYALDTIMGDGWYTVAVGLRYPSTVTVNPEFRSEKHIIVSAKKETVNPPKKFFLFRWFQKKHEVIHVDVVEKNPHCINGDTRYVEIIK